MKNWDKKLNEKLTSYEYKDDVSEEGLKSFFNQMDEPIDESSPTSFGWVWKAAASVIVVLGAGLIAYQIANQTITTKLDATAEIELPDGSDVILNAGSVLSYNKIGWILSRDLEMEGEAFFDVQKGSAFTVISNLGTTQVLGTSFNINTRNGSYKVACYTGKVKVKSGNKITLLTPGLGVNFEYDQTVQDFKFDTSLQNWANGEYHFDNVKLTRVIDDFELSYGKKIMLTDSIGNMKYSGFFPSNDMEVALKLICDPMGLTYEEVNDEILIKSISK